jgi:multisubunit Na+/H+ antiporter MnhB subunit
MLARSLWFPLSALISTGLLGVLVLQRHGIAAPRLGLMLGAILAGVTVATTLASRGREILERFSPALAVAALALLAATLLEDDRLGVRRWVLLGPIRLHASSIACPILLASTAVLLSRASGIWAAATLVLAQAIHALQPDAGQSTALAAGAVAGLAVWPAPTLVRVAGMGAVMASILPTWMRSDPLAPVPEVEGVVRLAGDLGRFVQILAVVLLALLPASLAIVARGVKPLRSGSPEPQRDGAAARATCAALAAYVAGTVIVPMLGNFPVPVLGFGVSPVLGIGICMGFSAALGTPARGAAEPAAAAARGPRGG